MRKGKKWLLSLVCTEIAADFAAFALSVLGFAFISPPTTKVAYWYRVCAIHAHVNIWHACVHVGWPCTHFRLHTSRICLDGHVMCLRSFHLTSFDVPTYVISCDVWHFFSSLCLSRYFSLWMMNYISLQVDWQIKWYEWHATPRKFNFRLWKCTDTSCDNITLWCMYSAGHN